MADRFPLIVNSVSKKIEELVSGDNLDLTGSGIVVSADTGAGKYLTSNGTTVFWGVPGDVYLTQTQTLTNKTLESCIFSGSNNNITNIANSSLVNSGITINGTTIALGGSVTTPDNNTTYVISAQDGTSASQKLLRLTSGGNFGANVDVDVTLAVGTPSSVPSGSNAVSLFLDRSSDTLTLSGHVVDNNTITTINAPGGSAQSGAINFTATGAATVSMTGSTVNIDALDTDTRTKIRAGSGGTYGPADTQQGLFTFLDGGATTVSQGVNGSTGDPEITYTSTDTVTQIRGGSTGTYTPSTTGTSTTQVSIEGGTNVTVSQTGNTINIDSVDTNTVTKVGSDNNGSPISPQAGDFVFKQAGATTITQSTNNSGQVEITVSSINSDTGASLTASNGLILATNDFRLKNASNLGGNTLLKWDDGNAQLADSIITDDGTTVTIGGDLVVSGTQTIFNTSVLQVEDNIIELRKGNNLTGFEAGIQVNRTTDATGVVTSYQQLQWNETGGYWRAWDGSVEKRFVTENETQVLTNKTLTNPTLTTPILGAATATSINGLEIASTASASLDIQSGKAVDIDRDLTFTSDNLTSNVNVNFRVGGDVAYKSDTLASFSSTTSTQLRTLISGTTGTDDLVFQTSPVILTSLVTTSTGFALLNSGAQSIQFGGAATVIDIGAQTGTITANGDLVVSKDLTVGAASTDLFTCNARVDFVNSDVLIRGGSSDPMTVGRGTGEVATNTAVGKQALFSVSSGSQNTATGYESLLTTNTGAGNTAYGYQALRNNGVGDNNTSMGRSAMLSNLSGDGNVALGANALETNTVGNSNVCLGFYAGFNATGSGNVLIGPADSGNPINDATYAPLNASGDRQLVIGSGTEFWIRGDSNFDVTLNNDVTVNSSLTVKGDFIVNGVQTVVKSNVLEVSDKNIELASVVSTTFTCATTDGSANITAISPTLGLIPGMAVTSNTAGVTVPGGTTIASISGNTATLSNNVTGSGTPTFSAIGPSDTAADGGGIILKGNPDDHTFTWSNANDAWQSSEDMELFNGKSFNIIDGAGNAQVVLSEGQVGPNSGTASLGTAVLTSSLTSVGTLVSLDVSGNSTLGASTTNNTLTINGSLIQNNDSAETAYASKSLPAGDSGFYIRNGNGGTGTYAALGLIASSTTAASDQSFSIVAQAQASGLVPKVAFTQRDGNNSQNETMTFSPAGKVGVGEDSPTSQLDIKGNVSSTTQFSGFDGLRIHNANGSAFGVTADMYFTVGTATTNRGAAIGVELESGNGGNDLYFATNPGSVTASDALVERFRIASDGEVRVNGDGSGSGYLRVYKDRDTAYSSSGGNGQDLIVQQFSDATNTGGYSALALQCNYAGQTGAWVAMHAVRTGVGTADFTINPRNNSTGDVERFRITSDGKVGINLVGSDNESPVRNLDIADSSGAIIRLKSSDDSLGANERLGEIEFYTDDDDGGHIGAFVKAIADPSDAFGRRTALTFGTQNSDNPPADAVERLRIDANGNLLFGKFQGGGTNQPIVYFLSEDGDLPDQTDSLGLRISNGNSDASIRAYSNSNSWNHVKFYSTHTGSIVTAGSITQANGNTISYNEASDYRLKENESPISDGITRLKQLKPYRFNWKNDSSTIVDGFFAHEVSSIVPQAITGEKDAVVTQDMIDAGEIDEAIGTPVYQQIDQAKLVPLLTASLQEAIAKIESLEARVSELEN